MDLTVSLSIPKPCREIAAVICDFGRLHEWHPAVERCEVEGEGAGAVRTYVVNGKAYRDRLLNVAQDGLGYFYEQLEGLLPVADLRAFLAVHPEGEEACRIEWSAQVAPGPMPPAAVETALTSITEAALDSFKTGLELAERWPDEETERDFRPSEEAS